MPGLPLEDRWRLLVTSFFEGPAGPRWRERLGPREREVRGLLHTAFAHDLAMAPRDIDREHLHTLFGSLLPGRVGDESWRLDLPDIVEDFLLHVAAEEGLTTAWEWSSAAGESRSAFEAALRKPDRPIPASGPRFEPEKRAAPKLGRNDPCFCGSGRKYKQCCLKRLDAGER